PAADADGSRKRQRSPASHDEVTKVRIAMQHGGPPTLLIPRGGAHQLSATERPVRAQSNPGRFEVEIVQDLEASVRYAAMGGDQHDVRIAFWTAPDDLKIRNDLFFGIRRLLRRLQIDHFFELMRIGGGRLEVTDGDQIPRNRDDDRIRGTHTRLEKIHEGLRQ